MTQPILQCTGLCKRYGKTEALSHVTFSLERGRVVGLLGPNGSGKTTLIKLANGLLRPTSGELRINGKLPGPETRAAVSYLPDRGHLPEWMSTKELLQLFDDFYEDFDIDRAADMLLHLGVQPNASLRSMSRGTREKVQLVAVMSRRAELYLLDEPIGGVDPAARDYILRTILTNRSETSTIVISTHLIADIERALDDVIFLQNGRVRLQQSVDGIHAQYGKSVDALFREVFQC